MATIRRKTIEFYRGLLTENFEELPKVLDRVYNAGYRMGQKGSEPKQECPPRLGYLSED